MYLNNLTVVNSPLDTIPPDGGNSKLSLQKQKNVKAIVNLDSTRFHLIGTQAV